MSWTAMLLMAGIIAVACIIAAVGVWLMDRGAHPALILAGYFTLAILAVGVAA